MYDIDQNGTIELQEMQKVLHSMFEILSFKKKLSREETCDEVAERIFQKLDKNMNGKVEAKELLESCKEDESLNRLLSHFVRFKKT